MERSATRAEIDQIAWNTIKTAAVSPEAPWGHAQCGRPANYAELGQMIEDWNGDFEHAWSEFLHEFFRYRAASFFAAPPPRNLNPGRRAILAGTPEYLSKKFNLPVPAWIEEPEYFLPEIWHPWSDMGLDTRIGQEARRAKSHECFLRPNVIFARRSWGSSILLTQIQTLRRCSWCARVESFTP